jgi:hypothetical protein
LRDVNTAGGGVKEVDLDEDAGEGDGEEEDGGGFVEVARGEELEIGGEGNEE